MVDVVTLTDSVGIGNKDFIYIYSIYMKRRPCLSLFRKSCPPKAEHVNRLFTDTQFVSNESMNLLHNTGQSSTQCIKHTRGYIESSEPDGALLEFSFFFYKKKIEIRLVVVGKINQVIGMPSLIYSFFFFFGGRLRNSVKEFYSGGHTT